MGYVAIGCRFLLGVVFAAAVVSKLRSPAEFAGFARSLVEMRLVPHRWRNPLAMLVVGAELATVALLATTPWAGSAAAAGVLAVLTGGVLLTIRRGFTARCRCFGSSAAPVGRVHVIRNSVLLAVAALGLATGLRPGPVTAAGVALALVAGGVLGLLTVRLDDLVDLFRPAVARRPSR